jgi:hypothetical protein
LGTKNKKLAPIPSNRHGILMENIAGTWDIINDFMNHCMDETKNVNASPT